MTRWDALDPEPRPGSWRSKALSFASQRAWCGALLLSTLISLPGLFVGFVGDDLLQRSMLEQRLEGYDSDVWSLYDFTPPYLPAALLIELGGLPWFSDPEVSLRFFRPLSSASLALDSLSFGQDPLLAHVHSLLWLLLLTFVSARLYQRWFSAPAAWLAAVVFAVAGLHATPAAWLASRHTLLAAALGASALWAWVRYREDAWWVGRWLAPACMVASLLSSESGLAALVFLLAYEVSTRGLGGALRGAAPWLLGLGFGYVACYAWLGYGPRGSGFYVSPFGSPLQYSSAALVGVPALAVELLLGLPAAVVNFIEGARVFFIAVGLLAALACATVLRRCRQWLTRPSRRALAWLSLASCVSLVTLVGTLPSGRVVPMPLLGAAAVLGNALWLIWLAARAAAGHRRVLWLLALSILGGLHLGLSPWLRVEGALQLQRVAQAHRDAAEGAEVGACRTGGYLYLLTGADPSLALGTANSLRLYTPSKAGARRVRVLSPAPQDQELTRVAYRAFELEVLDSPRRSNLFEHLFRSRARPLVTGQYVQLSDVTVHVQAVDEGRFTRARFEVEHSLDGEDICLMAWRGGRLRAVNMPALGESVVIPHEPGPMGL